MCGRYTLADPSRAFSEFSILEKAPSLDPRYNIAPAQLVSVIRIVPPERERRVDRLRWGLVPPWASDTARRARGEAQSSTGFINARVESVATKPAFARAFRERRCIFVADGFYEWKRVDRRKIPHFIRRPDGGPFAIAGLWEPRAAALGHDADGCALITRPSLPPVDSLHDRMPVVLDPRDVETWLDPEVRDVTRLRQVLARGDDVELVLSAVGPRVNSPANDDPGCIAPLSDAELGRNEQRRLF